MGGVDEDFADFVAQSSPRLVTIARLMCGDRQPLDAPLDVAAIVGQAGRARRIGTAFVIVPALVIALVVAAGVRGWFMSSAGSVAGSPSSRAASPTPSVPTIPVTGVAPFLMYPAVGNAPQSERCRTIPGSR